MGKKEPDESSSNGGFKVEKNDRKFVKPAGDRCKLDRYGTLGDCIERVISAGAYISFGQSTDGGSVLIRVLDGDSKLSKYCHHNYEVLEAMEALNQRYKRTDTPTPLFSQSQPPETA